MNTLQYKGYTGTVEVDLEGAVVFGRVQDIRDVVTFQSESVADLRQAFIDSIDDYLEWCADRGEEPDRPYSGKLILRTSPERHRRIAQAARVAGQSINSWMDETLRTGAEALLGRGAQPADQKSSVHAIG